MACIISLIDPTINLSIKDIILNEIYRDAEIKVKELNEKLNKKSNKKELFWTVTIINPYS